MAPVLSPQYDYIFAIGMIFSFLDAWNIGANDVANSFATSVSSRSLTLKQAMMVATVMEFTGSVAVGARVADTIRSKILKVAQFEKNPEVLMLGMMCALIGSSTWLSIATKLGLPVSTTHCIVGGVIGMGIASLGTSGVVWGWDGKGVAQIVASWAIAPAISAAFGAIIFSITKYAVLKRSNPLKWGFFLVPIYFAFTSGILTMVVVWKGAQTVDLSEWGPGQLAGCILGVAFGVALLVSIFFVPFLKRKLVDEDWTLRWYHVVLGPALLYRGPVPAPPHEVQIIQDYYRGHATKEDLQNANLNATTIKDMEHLKANHDLQAAGTSKMKDIEAVGGTVSIPESETDRERDLAALEKEDAGPWYLPRNLGRIIWKGFMHGVEKDVVAEQAQNSKSGALVGNIAEMHARAAHFDNKTEHLYSFLQVLTAATASFAHGANDVSNAVGPLATIFLIWNTGKVSSKAPVPIWILVYGGAAIVIGLWTYGYNIMRNLGNRLTLHSPTRGFSMELGAATTVVMATRLALPVSTTQCIVGSTMGVALCNGDLKALNWRIVAWCYMGWIITLPIAGIISGCVMGIIINAPRLT